MKFLKIPQKSGDVLYLNPQHIVAVADRVGMKKPVLDIALTTGTGPFVEGDAYNVVREQLHLLGLLDQAPPK